MHHSPRPLLFSIEFMLELGWANSFLFFFLKLLSHFLNVFAFLPTMRHCIALLPWGFVSRWNWAWHAKQLPFLHHDGGLYMLVASSFTYLAGASAFLVSPNHGHDTQV